MAVTDGERSHQGHGSPAALARRRTLETTAALRALGAQGAEEIRLGLPDSGLADREERLVNVLAPLVKGFDLCLAPWDHDMHPTMRRPAGSRKAAAGAFYSFPIWMWHWASPADRRVPWDRAVWLPLPPRAASRKRAAITCFASQTKDRGHGLGPVLTRGMIAHFTRTVEILLP